jgi:hypothetical protein
MLRHRFAVGFHYPISILPVQDNASLYAGLWSLPQKLWASEEYSTYSDASGARCLAKLFNRNFVDANFTSSLVWDMMWSSLDGLACAGDGLFWAAEPWSGLYGVVDTTWAMAHTTQFTAPGWRYSPLFTPSDSFAAIRTSIRVKFTFGRCRLCQ